MFRPKAPMRKMGMVFQAYNTSVGEMEREESLQQASQKFLPKQGQSISPSQRNKVGSSRGKHLTLACDVPRSTHTHTCVHLNYSAYK